ncbi:MAG: PDZ domain-containing protein [Candidatus Sumerlaeota bacterium]|nr:PDZ domain-containing protein [Candidatus Sumerlaeota bacterium]
MMFRVRTPFLFCIAMPLILAMADRCDGGELSGASVTFHVAPGGDDANPGTIEKPFATLPRARDAVRKTPKDRPITVYLRAGKHRLARPLVFGPENSGSEAAPVVYSSYPGEEAIVVGSCELKLQWERHSETTLKAQVPAGLDFDQLWINGRKMIRCRYPNYDPGDGFYGGSIREQTPETSADAISPERLKGYADPVGAYVHGMMSLGWSTLHFQITKKAADGVYTFECDKDPNVVGGYQSKGRAMRSYDRLAPGRMFIENVFEELDAPGEWFLDRKSDTLYFIPPAGLDLDKALVEGVVLEHLFEFRGTESAPVRFITLQGLTLGHTRYTFMKTKSVPSGGDWRVYRGGAVLMEGTENCAIRDCFFDRIGGNGVFIKDYNRDAEATGCKFVGTGASAVLVEGNESALRSRWAHSWGWPEGEVGEIPLVNGKAFDHISFAQLPPDMLDGKHPRVDMEPGAANHNYPARCLIQDNLMHGLGTVEKQISGVFISKAQNITVSHNTIYDVPRAAINVNDGCWGGHAIEWNEVFDTSLATREHGAFNSWGRDRYWIRMGARLTPEQCETMQRLARLDCVTPIVLRHNRFQCAYGYDIDLDDGSANYQIMGNVCLQGGIKCREGYFRVVENNITPLFSPHVWYPNSADVVQKNIILDKTAYSPRGMKMEGCADGGRTLDYNLFRYYEPSESFKQLGIDAHSKTGDPMFMDPEKGDFRVKPDSPALALGFENFPMDQFGVTKPEWKAEAPAWSGLSRAYQEQEAVERDTRVYQWMGARLRSLVNYGRESQVVGAMELADNNGVLVIDVSEGSPAARGGLTADTVILGVNGKPVSGIEDLKALVGAAKQSAVALRIMGNEGTREMSLALAPGQKFRPEPEKQAKPAEGTKSKRS